MTNMLVQFVLIICLTDTFGHMVRNELDPDIPPLPLHELDPDSPPLKQKDPIPGTPPLQWRDIKHESQALKRQDVDHGNPPQQWQDLVTIVNRKLEGMERLLTEKVECIDQLELNIASQMAVIKKLQRGMTSLKEELSEKDEIVGILVGRVSHLEGIVMSDSIPSERESRKTLRSQFPRTVNETQLDLVLNSDSRFESSVEKMFISKPSVPEAPNYQNGGVILPQSKPQNRNGDIDFPDTSGEDNTVVYTEDESEDLSKAKYQKRETSSSQSPKTTIAFHAAIIANKAVTENDDVVYDQEMLDLGNGYSPQDGIYTVPESGTYVLTWTTICGFHDKFQTLLIVNGATRGSSWTSSEEITDNHQTTAIVVLTLNEGDHVLIRMGYDYGHGTIVGKSYMGVPTFSGWKLN